MAHVLYYICGLTKEMFVELNTKDITETNSRIEKIWVNLNYVERVVPFRGNPSFVVLHTTLGMKYFVEEKHWEEVINLLKGGNRNGRFC